MTRRLALLSALVGLGLAAAAALAGNVAVGYGRPTVISTAGVGSPRAITAGESGTLFTNYGATEQAYFTLPAAQQGLYYDFNSVDGDGLRITAQAGDYVSFGPSGVVSATGGYVATVFSGTTLGLLAIDSDDWVTVYSPNAARWTVDGAHTGMGAYGELTWSVAATTVLTGTDPLPLAGTTADAGSSGFTASTAGRLTYTGTGTRRFMVFASLSLSSQTGSSTTGTVTIRKNGAATSFYVQRFLSGVNDMGVLAVHGIVTMSTNNYVELWCNTNNGVDLQAELGSTLSVLALD